MGLERRVSALVLWRSNFLWLGLNYLGGASFAALIVVYRQQFDLAMIAVVVPLIVITYLTFRTSVDRLEDANRHVSQLNELYLSTIETLAMAVDAKDQITHGHIRRVQVYATELGRRMGVTDHSQLRAIEAAALLHDMGKLAIPETILNKPGKLSDAEYDRIKEHASIGADLLSVIRFPYPVVPIVRHHHEFWNGKGYPSGISGTDIPLGARILSVVDCFDALTSDRPYRPRLSRDEAFAILRERRGSMYDPLVVDRFVGAFDDIHPLAVAAGEQARSLIPGVQADQWAVAAGALPLRQIRASAEDSALSFEVRRALLGASSPQEAFLHVARYIRQQTPATLCALFRPEPGSDLLTCVQASGEGAELLLGFSIRTGERITGWAAAHRQTICNSDPTLDFGNIVKSFRCQPKSTLAAPILDTDSTLGVVTAYALTQEAFSNDHRHTIDEIVVHLGRSLRESEKEEKRLLAVENKKDLA